MRARLNRDRIQLRFEQLENRELLTANAFEQHAVYLINVERHERDLPPLAISGRLMESSGVKAETLDTCFRNICNGKGPTDLAKAAGYDATVNEVLAQFTPAVAAEKQAAQAVDTWMANAGLRRILMGDKTEIGVGRAKQGNRVYWSAHVGTSDPDAVYLTGVTYRDRNDNGRYDYGEGLAGKQIQLNGLARATTNAGGGWKINVDPNNTYDVSLTHSSASASAPIDVRVQNESRSVDFEIRSETPIVDFAGMESGNTSGGNNGNNTSGGGTDETDHGSDANTTTLPRNKGRVSGTVFFDTNGNGVRSSTEPGLVGWKIYVDANANGRHDKRELSTRTDENGRYELDIPPMRPAGYGHQITVELNSGFVNTSKTGHSVLIQKGVHKSGKNFAVQGGTGSGNTSTVVSQSPFGRVSGRVFLDQNENRIKTSDEELLAGWVVYVDANRNGVRDATDPQDTTDANGRYEFELRPSKFKGFGHRVSVVAKSGFENTTTASRSVLVEAGVHKTNKDFGFIRTNGISGFVFRDADRDGTLDAGEAKLGGQTVFVDANQNGRLDSTERFTRTNQNGKYEFKSLKPGNYTVIVIANSNFELTTSNTRNVSVQPDRISTNRNFGVRASKVRTSRPR